MIYFDRTFIVSETAIKQVTVHEPCTYTGGLMASTVSITLGFLPVQIRYKLVLFWVKVQRS